MSSQNPTINFANIEQIIGQIKTHISTLRSSQHTPQEIQQYKDQLDQAHLYVQNLSKNLAQYNISIDNINLEKYKNSILDIKTKMRNIKTELDSLLS
jgi:chromosome segregation ATPase